ncbi:uncharacterized protein PHALS_14039 [Plasmopara halstedii]|uniref:Uncharacterized protein n=1 Tax=Plasmopara halstedii TaxID=4781 RepID=A0A0N7L6A7_PLAHL|nr:uncharacterized protein PHALS_14039 [Plasmopara halstedii]CEG43747.1 hypothetical protein PHALS_14039 [Plasmopara halstedii]|eukprot:XP_024580116.1 hypothetical protein PHALS_14039 [Plasmopara halstedii]
MKITRRQLDFTAALLSPKLRIGPAYADERMLDVVTENIVFKMDKTICIMHLGGTQQYFFTL